MHKNKGFTLIEVLIVIAIIGILAAIAIPSYQRYIHAAKSADLLTHIQTLRERVAIEQSSGNWPPSIKTAPHPGIWPSPLTLSASLLDIQHFKTQIAITSDGRPLAVFIATDSEGRFIVEEVRRHLPEKLINGHFNRTLIGVWLADKISLTQPSNQQTAQTTQPPTDQPAQPAQPAQPSQQPNVIQNQLATSSNSPKSGQTASQTTANQHQNTPPKPTAAIVPAVQSAHIPVVTIPPECIKHNGGYYHRNPHRPNCPL